MTEAERKAQMSFAPVAKNFLGKHKGDNYVELVKCMLKTFKDLGFNKH